MQMCHDVGLSQCVFRRLDGDVAGEAKPEPEPQGTQQRGWAGVMAAIGTVSAAAVVAGAVQMGYLPDSLLGSLLG